MFVTGISWFMISNDDAFDSDHAIHAFSKTEDVQASIIFAHTLGHHALTHRKINQGVLFGGYSLFMRIMQQLL